MATDSHTALKHYLLSHTVFFLEKLVRNVLGEERFCLPPQPPTVVQIYRHIWFYRSALHEFHRVLNGLEKKQYLRLALQYPVLRFSGFRILSLRL